MASFPLAGNVRYQSQVQGTYLVRAERRGVAGVVTADRPVENTPGASTRVYTGYVLLGGSPYLSGATVLLFRNRDHVLVGTTTSSPIDGSFSFPRPNRAETYYTVVFTADGTLAGSSLSGRVSQ